MGNVVYQYYPTGYRVPLVDGPRTENAIDVQVAALYNEFKSNPANCENFEFRQQVIECAKRLFGQFHGWLDAQDHNVKISKHAYDFIEDTLEFISTGRRPIEILSRLGIIDSERASGKYENDKAEQRRTRLRDKLSVPSREYLYHWLRHRGGFEDMLCTLNFIFGTDFRK